MSRLTIAAAVAIVFTAALSVLSALSQGPLDPSVLLKPPVDAWPTYHGDYSGKHYSTLKQINLSNVRSLSLAWIYRTTASTDGAIVSGAPVNAPAGFGGPPPTGTGPAIKAMPLLVNGVLYFTAPNHIYAVDARTARLRWHYVWRGRSAIGNRGVGMYGNSVFAVMPDNTVVSLEADTGKERWAKKLTPPDVSNWSTVAPIVIRNHVIVGIGGDTPVGATRGFVESLDPETGASQWKWWTTPNPGETGFETWPSEEAAMRSAGAPWQPATYDPDLNLLIVPTGQPTPTYNGKSRPGANLYTCSIVALNPDTGKLVWYYQTSPHDTHDWDATEVPILVDATLDERPRKLIAQANRNGYYFLLDRTNGTPIVVKPFSRSNSYLGVKNGVLVPNPEKEGSPGGTLVFPTSDGAVNYPMQAYSPDTRLFYTNATEAGSIFYLSPDPSDPTGLGRGQEWHGGMYESRLVAMDVLTGDVKWQHAYPLNGWGGGTSPGVLTTAGGLLFTGDPSGDLIAFDATSGEILWHAQLGTALTNTPQTYMLDGHQYVTVAAGDTLWAFYLQ
ncbi:MAG TPA: acido-empty-quinoprotein group A [Vicinamibacterales bacterium]